ncbi:MAG TPA: asparaginase domain-containing protein [Solirubrobacteraceae bacterium]|nr:asparaginase domain-containing protein [Solirubrobacteraceae bacterium]
MIAIAMGGTIDKDYIVESAALEVVDPFVSWIMPQLRMAEELPIVPLLRKDSLVLDDADRSRLLAYIVEHDLRRLLVSHGTDTLLVTASAVAQARVDGTLPNDVTAVFFGAFRPGRFSPAEASFNFGFAFAVAQSAPPGVYIAMGGRYDTIEHVTHANGQFLYE